MGGRGWLLGNNYTLNMHKLSCTTYYVVAILFELVTGAYLRSHYCVPAVVLIPHSVAKDDLCINGQWKDGVCQCAHVVV